MNVVQILSGFSGATFLVYGVICFYSPSMASDFHRFGLEFLRIPTGILELLGGAGLLIGLKWLPAQRISAAGLTLLMLVAFGIRMKMRDGVAVSAPSFLLMLLNAYIFFKSTDTA